MAEAEDTPVGPELVVEFVGDERVLGPGDELTFGRRADLVIDDNRYLHRVLGRFSCTNGLWWLSNVGSAVVINVGDAASTSSVKVAPGTAVPVSFRSATIAFEAGGANYELRVERLDDGDDGSPLAVGAPLMAAADDLEATTTASSLPLSDEQRVLLVALAEPWLRSDGTNEQLATNRQIAQRLGWTITKYNRKLDGLCKKYASAGVSGLRGSSDALARDRRARLAEHVVHAGIVTARDLPLLDD